MRKLMLIAVIGTILCAGCIPLMHPTVARQVVRVDKNCDMLLGNYKALLIEGTQPEDVEHDVALIDATLVLTEDMRKTAELSLGKKKEKAEEEVEKKVEKEEVLEVSAGE